jgi:hypothetical protein
MSKNEPNATTIIKYDVDAAIDEVENSEDQSVFKYAFTILSDPKNVRLSIDGIARIHGDSIEREEILTKDENEVPKILTIIYQELFPTFFLLSKTLNVSCPPHNIGKMSETTSQETPESETTSQETPESETTSQETPESETTSQETPESETIVENSTNEVELETPNTSKQ